MIMSNMRVLASSVSGSYEPLSYEYITINGITYYKHRLSGSLWQGGTPPIYFCNGNSKFYYNADDIKYKIDAYNYDYSFIPNWKKNTIDEAVVYIFTIEGRKWASLVLEEKKTTNYFYDNHSYSVRQTNPKNVAPYQPFSVSFGGSFREQVIFYDSADATLIATSTKSYNSLAQAESIFGKFYIFEYFGYQNLELKSDGNIIEQASFSDVYEPYDNHFKGGINFPVSTIAWANDYYEIRQKPNTNFKIYAGKEVGSDFLNAHELVYIQSNEYKTNEYIYNASLTKTRMSNTVLKQSDTSFVFDYSYAGIVVSNKTISNNLVKLHATTPYQNISQQSVYTVGDYIENFDPKTKGSLTYSDGTTISLNAIEYVGTATVSTSIGNLPLALTQSHVGTFNMTYNLPTKHFGTLQPQFQITVKQDMDVSYVLLKNPKTRFEYGDTLVLGSTALNTKVECYNKYDVLIETIPFANFSGRVITNDTRFGKTINGTDIALTTNELSINYIVDGIFTITQKFKMSYAKVDSVVVDSSGVNKLVYIDHTFSGFTDLDQVSATITYYDNSGATLNTQTNVALLDLICSYQQPNPNIDTQYVSISVSGKYKNQTLAKANAFEIRCERIRPVSVLATITDPAYTTTLTYYDNNQDTFKIPTDLTFKLMFNDSSEAIINPATQLTFYRDNTYGQALTVGSSVIALDNTKPTESKKIYFKHNASGLTNDYAISFVIDEITSVELGETANFILGNRFKTMKSVFKVKVSYTSGIVVNDFQNFVFKNPEHVVLTSTAPVIYINDGKNDPTTEWTLSTSSIVFNKPNIDKVVVIHNEFTKSYSNQADYLNAIDNVSVYTYYENAEYVETCVYNKGSLTANGQYTITSDVLDASFDYDGTELINVNMENKPEIFATLTFSVLNYFDNENTTNNSTDIIISILEIVNITGISLLNVKRDYYVGDLFLQEGIDNTQIAIYYVHDNITKKKIINLSSNFGGINVFPLKNTKFLKPYQALVVRISASNNSNVNVQYTISVVSKYVAPDEMTKNNLRVVFANYYMHDNVPITNKYFIVDDEMTEVINGQRKLKNGKLITDTDVKVYGYLDNVNESADIKANGKVVFFDDYLPITAGESNIMIKYPSYVKEHADFINKCRFGQLFGNNNAKNRLFLSGNPDFPNADWHSGGINKYKADSDFADENGDFTYFEDTSYCFYGQTDNAVVGYDIVAHDKMVVLKSKSDKEPTIYYRTSGLIQALDASGNAVVGIDGRPLYEENYPLIIGSIGVGALTNKGIINFNGDTLFLSSDKQLDGLDIDGIIGDTQRYANTRSFYINPLLKTLNLNDAWLFTNNKYLFIITRDFVLLSHFETFNTETRQYEWWKINIPNISAVIEINDELYFGNTTGRFVKMINENSYQDITKIFLNTAGSVVPVFSDGIYTNEIQISSANIQKLVDCEQYMFNVVSRPSAYDSYMYGKIANIDNIKSDNADLFVDTTLNALELVGYINGQENSEKITQLMKRLTENKTYYINKQASDNQIMVSVDNTPLKTYGKAYELRLYNEFVHGRGLLFTLHDKETGEMVDLSPLIRGSLCERLTADYLVVDIDYDNARFRLQDISGQDIDIVRYGNQNIETEIRAEIKKLRNVKAYYITAPQVMGDIMHNKTIWAFSITNDTQIPSEIEICQATNELHLESMAKIVDFNQKNYGLNLESFSIADINFEKYVIPHKYTYYKPLNVPFISFGFRNNENSNALLSAMQIIYSTPFASVGNH